MDQAQTPYKVVGRKFRDFGLALKDEDKEVYRLSLKMKGRLRENYTKVHEAMAEMYGHEPSHGMVLDVLTDLFLEVYNRGKANDQTHEG